MMVIFSKAKPYPDGTIRSHGGKKYKKREGGWLPVKEGMTASEREESEKDSKSKKIKINKIEGTEDLFRALEKVASAKSPIYMDDVTGADKKLFNALTKDGLLTWTHVAGEEYKAELTDSGTKSYAAGHAYFNKTERERKKEDAETVDMEFDTFEDLIKIVSKIKNK
jgi:hypothetical protein